MARRLQILLAIFICTQFLTGCDTVNQLINTIPMLRRQVAQCHLEVANDTATKRALLAALSRQAAIAQACKWGIQICPDALARPLRFKVQIGDQVFSLDPNPWLFDILVSFKLGLLAALLVLFLLALWRMYFSAIKPDMKAIAAARIEISTAKDRVEETRLEEQRIKAQASKLKADLQSEARSLAETAKTLMTTRDALLTEVELLEERRRRAQATNDLVKAAFKPRKK